MIPGPVETEYYRVEIGSPFPRSSGWRAPVRILRKDSWEVYERLSADAESKDAAVSLAYELASTRMAELSKPVDWGRDPEVPALLRLYGQWREEAAAAAWEVQKSCPWDDAPTLIKVALKPIDERWMGLLTARVNRLSVDQQVALVSLTPRQLEKPTDIWVADEIIAKQALFHMLENPAIEVVQAKSRAEQLLDEVR